MSLFGAMEAEQLEAWNAALRSWPAHDRCHDIPSPDELRRRLDSMAVPEDFGHEAAADCDRFAHNAQTLEFVNGFLTVVTNYMGSVARPPLPTLPALQDVNDPQFRYFYLWCYACAVPYARHFHAARGIPRHLGDAMLQDIGRNVRVHAKRYGQGGLGTHWWHMLHVRGVIYELGRLQFELAQLGDAVAADIRDHGDEAFPDDVALSVHIPDFLGPMTPEACEAAFASARVFFPTYFHDHPVRYAVCHSWLLDPQLNAYLRPESNIIRFQQQFHLGERGWNSDDGVIRFVFGPRPDDLTELPGRTSLERAIATHLTTGKHWYGVSGWRRLADSMVTPA